jgi:hypothetical protein
VATQPTGISRAQDAAERLDSAVPRPDDRQHPTPPDSHAVLRNRRSQVRILSGALDRTVAYAGVVKADRGRGPRLPVPMGTRA